MTWGGGVCQDLRDCYLSDTQNDAFLSVASMLNVKYFITDPSQEPMLNDEALGNAWFIDELYYVNSANEEMAALAELDLSRQAVADSKFAPILGKTPTQSAQGKISLTSYAPDRLEYPANSDNGGLAVFSEVYFPWGWSATIDGEPTELGRVNYLLRAMQIPAGEHTIVMQFRPDSIAATNTAATVAVICVYLLLAVGIILAIRQKKWA